MKTIEVKLYKFDELEPYVQELVIERRCEALMHEPFYWADEYVDSLNRFCELFALTYTPSRYDYSVDIRTWELPELVKRISGMRLRTWIINNHYNSLLYEKKVYHKADYTKKRSSRIGYVLAECPLSSYAVCSDIPLISPFQEFVNRQGVYANKARFDRTDLEDIIIESNRLWNRAIIADCEHQYSKESALELIEADDYDFTEKGEVYW